MRPILIFFFFVGHAPEDLTYSKGAIKGVHLLVDWEPEFKGRGPGFFTVSKGGPIFFPEVKGGPEVFYSLSS